MSAMKTCFLVACLILATCSAEEPQQFGQATKCDKKVVENFNLSAYMGEWYEIAKFGRTPFEDGGVCIIANYSRAADGNVTVVNSKLNRTSHIRQNATGVAWMGPVPGEAKLTVQFGGPAPPGNYWVLSTDYDHYSIVWSCGVLPNGNISEISWILSRSKMLSPDTEKKVKDELKVHNLTWESYEHTKQDPETCKTAGAAALTGVATLALLAAALANRLL